MRFIIIIVIALYWKLIPKEKRRSCLFSVSCSRYVYECTKKEGFFSGLKAFIYRFKRCRKGYHIETQNGQFFLKLCDGTVINESEIAPNILYPIKLELQNCIDQLNGRI
jgi:putative component of membrane protein insertase Oxa1/YidC/SpoIIIJ protein YidD